MTIDFCQEEVKIEVFREALNQKSVPQNGSSWKKNKIK